MHLHFGLARSTHFWHDAAAMPGMTLGVRARDGLMSDVNPGAYLSRLRGWGPYCLAAVMLGLGAWWIGDVLLGSNLHTVIAGRVYRGAQPSEASLERVIQAYGIRTIVNLRGCGNPQAWYFDECTVAQRHGIGLEDISFSATHLPAPGELRSLLEVLERTEYPIFLHCRHGADRTGLAAAIVLALQEEVPYRQARGALGLYYGHLSFGRTGLLDRFFDLYEEWLEETGQEHTPARFRHWIVQEYRGGWCAGGVEQVTRLTAARANEPIGYRVRFRNGSRSIWQVRPTKTAGVHVFFHVYDANGDGVAEGRAGMLDASVAPGECLDVTMVLPPLAAGWHWLQVDLIEEYHCCLYQAGGGSWEGELVVRE
jgi:protein tyrosine phosphatase (PTP) superfamily phosphohydrolase (DUF442 family)